MCGIFGIILGEQARIGQRVLRRGVARLFRLSESRGMEASGIGVKRNGPVVVHKSALRASRLVASDEYRAFMKGAVLPPGEVQGKYVTGPLAIIGHSRLVTNGDQGLPRNNQPVACRSVTGVHNGIVVNEAEIRSDFPLPPRRGEVDSEAIMGLIWYFRGKTGSMTGALAETFKVIDGSASVAVLFDDADVVGLATNTGSLYLCREAGLNPSVLVFASEEHILRRLLATTGFGRGIAFPDMEQIRPGRGCVIDPKQASVIFFDFPLNAVVTTERPGLRPVGAGDVPVADPPPDLPGLRRCTRCVLPHTMPYIDFDDDGVCSYCRSYEKMSVAGREDLERLLAAYRGRDGRPDCIVTFSGGRDSSYGLHLLKTELGMNPVALTYDWGMVTDLARRNQARICGKLGIEHILISADIAGKRANIRKNINAWLRRPDLGLVPLFMAGDKQFFYHFREVRRRTGIRLVVLCVNPLEKTEFKFGFCRVRQKKNVIFYKIPLRGKLDIAFYYLKNFIKNPAYLNTSLFDTFTAYLASYFLKHDYLLPFEYVRWDEQTINDVLINEYGWETAEDTASTWRIGDGTAPFYNYIYHRVAGLTENDTFRSNQIREGVLTRDQALWLVHRENQPRWDSIREYLDTVGLDFDRVMGLIDAMPRMY